VRPEHIKTLEDVSRVPFTVKDELRRSQEKSPPYGDFHCISPEQGVRVFQTTGTTGIPVRSLLSKKDWLEVYYDQFMYFMYGYGITKADTIFIPFNYGLYLAWWGIHSSFEQGGVLVIPGGGQSSEDRIKNILEWKPTVVCGTPTYILFLGETAKKMGVDLSKTTVRIVITAGEPGGGSVELRKLLSEGFGGAKIFDLVGEASDKMKDFKKLMRGTLQIGTTKNYARYIMPSLLSEFQRRFPRIKVILDEGNSEDMAKSVLEKKNELALISQLNLDRKIKSIFFSTVEFVLVASPEHRFSQRKSISLRELNGEPVILREKGSGSRAAILRNFRNMGFGHR
jgi:hypothetical protein